MEAELFANGLLGEGALSRKHKALIAAACAITARCDYCSTEFSRYALELGVTREELIEAVAVAQSVGFEFDQAHHDHKTARMLANASLSEWCWTQDDGCVLGTCDS